MLLALFESSSIYARVEICGKAAQGSVIKPLANHNCKTRAEPGMKQLSPNVYSTQSTEHAPPFEPTLERREINLREVIALILLHRKTVAVIAMLFVLAGLNFALARERLFVANSRVLIDPIGIQVLDRDVMRRAESSDAGVAVVESQMRVMTSASILKQVVAKENLVDDPEFLEGSSNLISRMIGSVTGAIRAILVPSWDVQDTQVKVLLNLGEAVHTSRPKLSYIVDLYVKTKNPKKSARLANTIVRTYINSETVARSNLARRASGTLSARLAELRSELTEAEKAVEHYKANNNILDSNGSLINEQELEQLNRLLIEAGARTSLAQSHLDQIEAVRQSSSDLNNIPEALSSQTISKLRIKLTTVLQRRSILSTELLPPHPTMLTVEAQTEAVRQQIRQELSRIAGQMKVEFDRAQNEQSQIKKRLDAIKQSTLVTNDAQVRLRALKRDADAKRTVYKTFLLRAKELDEQVGVDTTRARIISFAVPPIHPSGLPSILILVGALIAGLVAGVLTVLVRQ